MSKLVAPHGGKGLVCALLEGAVGKRSAAKMDEKELTIVIEVMKSKGFQVSIPLMWD